MNDFNKWLDSIISKEVALTGRVIGGDVKRVYIRLEDGMIWGVPAHSVVPVEYTETRKVLVSKE